MLEIEPSINIYSYCLTIFRYKSNIRELILRAKIKNDLEALNSIISLVIHSKRIPSFLNGIDLIIPAASSAWGRIRGKLDIAWLLAEKLSQKFQIPMQNPPSHHYWKWFKRSKKRNRAFVGLPEFDRGEKHILLVDDLLTTGYTLDNMCQSFPNSKISFLTIATGTYMTKNPEDPNRLTIE